MKKRQPLYKIVKTVLNGGVHVSFNLTRIEMADTRETVDCAFKFISLHNRNKRDYICVTSHI